MSKFEENFSLIACLSSSMTTGVWYRDSGTSCHMTRVHEFFTRLRDKDIDLHVEMGNDAKYKAADRGVVAFQRYSSKPLIVTELLYIPRLTKNLLSISSLEDRGYVETFYKGNSYI